MDLNNREIATLVWLFVSFVVILKIQWMRDGILAAIKVIFMRRMLRWSLIMCGYLAVTCYGLHRIDMWSLADLKASVLWLITAGFYMVYQTVHDEPLPRELFSGTFKNGFNIAVVLEFLIGTVSLPLLAELVLLPAAAFLTFIASPSKSDGTQALQVRRFANALLTVIGAFLIIHALTSNFLGWETFWQAQTAHQFFMPILLSFALIPYLWGILCYLAYEQIMWRFNALPLPASRRRFFMLKALCEFGFRYYEVRNWWRYSIQTRPEDYSALIHSLAESKDFDLEPDQR
jgi:hypothetical protein